jgi:hypothetical protein
MICLPTAASIAVAMSLPGVMAGVNEEFRPPGTKGGIDRSRLRVSRMAEPTNPRWEVSQPMIVLGVILLLLGLLFHVGILWTIGIIVLIIGAVLLIAGQAGRPVMGRRYWW